jgi:multidrug resistance efflux pump
VTPVLAPTSGYYQERTPVGSLLKVNDEIGRLVPISPSPLRTEWQLRLSQLKIRLEGQKAALERAQAAQESVTRILAAERDRARVEQHSLSNQIAGQRKRLEGVNADLKRGKVTSAQAAAEAARLAHLNSAELGFSGAAGRAGERPPAEVERDIGQTLGEIAALERALSEGSDSTPVRSSCECILHAASRNGEYVERGAPLAHLTPPGAQTGSGLWQVDALVRPDQVQAIALGDPVELGLGPSLDPIPGRVAAISYDPASRPRLGLPAPLIAAGRFARVSIEAEGKQPAPALGTPVRVRFQPALRTGIALVDGIAARLKPELASGSAPGTYDR